MLNVVNSHFPDGTPISNFLKSKQRLEIGLSGLSDFNLYKSFAQICILFFIISAISCFNKSKL